MSPEPTETPIRNRQGIPGRKAVFWLVIALIVMIGLLAVITFFAVRQIESTTAGFASLESTRPSETARG